MRAGRVIAYVALLGCTVVAGGAADASDGSATEAYPAFGLAESSGLAASVLHDGVVWVVEDSGEPPEELPVVRAFDQSGTEVGSVTLAGWNNRDTEALSMGPGPTLWVADIGDNKAVRESVVVHTFAEPVALATTTLEPVSYRLRYPDGPVNAEALMVDPIDGRVYVATKSLVGGGSLYVVPEQRAAGETLDLTFVTTLHTWITDGSFTPDGTQLLLLRAMRGINVHALVFDVSRPGGGAPIELTQVAEIGLPSQNQPEMLTVTRDGSAILVGSEGEDEPVWSVPLSAAATDSPDPESPSPADEPVATAVAADEPAGCRLSDPMSCADEATGWLIAVAVVLLALMIIPIAMLRRSRP